MQPPPKREEIDHRTIKLIVGAIAILLPILTSAFSDEKQPSISAYYHVGKTSGSIFIGFLFAIAAFLAAYNGLLHREMVLAKVAAISALGVALFPCDCGVEKAAVPYVHYICAAVMFVILIVFCNEFRKRAQTKGYPQAERRAIIYTACAAAILLSMVLMGLTGILKETITNKVPRIVFYSEALGLIAFGISWLTASRVFPVLANPKERFSPLRRNNPADEPTTAETAPNLAHPTAGLVPDHGKG